MSGARQLRLNDARCVGGVLGQSGQVLPYTNESQVLLKHIADSPLSLQMDDGSVITEYS